jgi:putative nucleotidyltransferase with HDIG domain
MLAVEAAMRAYARKLGGDEELWGLTGLLHDLDYERYPSLEDGHPRYGMRELEARGYPDEMVRAVGSHADFLGIPRESPMEKSLYAVDELCGFILACAYVRPDGLHGMTPKSVKKKLKTPAFAAAVSRDDVRAGAEELGVDFDEHLAFVIAALAEHAYELLPARDSVASAGSPNAAAPADSAGVAAPADSPRAAASAGSIDGADGTRSAAGSP